MKPFDVCVIGAGGVVGSAILRALASTGLSVLGLERHDGPARETSGLNSRVVHSGFHEIPGTLKSELALAGSRMLISYAEEKGVPLLRSGMLIAVPRGAIQHGLWREAGALWHLWRNGRSHGVQFKWIVSSSGIRKLAPIQAIGGIFIPSVCVVDILELVASLQRDAVARQADVRYNCPALNIRTEHGYYIVSTPIADFEAKALVNSAGLAAASVSKMAGGPAYSVELLRGEYYELRGGMARWGIRTLVYPAMPARSPSKGVHFGPRTDGRLFIGPNAMDVNSPPAAKSTFIEAARKFLPDIRDEDLEYSCAGIRPKHSSADGVSDFVIRLDHHNPALINLIGIDSPGLSSSMAIAQRVGDMLRATS